MLRTVAVVMAAVFALSVAAHAVPAWGRHTGADCSSCHWGLTSSITRGACSSCADTECPMRKVSTRRATIWRSIPAGQARCASSPIRMPTLPPSSMWSRCLSTPAGPLTKTSPTFSSTTCTKEQEMPPERVAAANWQMPNCSTTPMPQRTPSTGCARDRFTLT